jgi:DinB superfamily
MTTTELARLFERDLHRLTQEIAAYATEKCLWELQTGIANPGGTLCLHLLGNLNEYVGSTLGHADFVRNRPEEFSLRDVPQAELLARLANLRTTVGETLIKLTEADLVKQYPVEVLGYPMTTGHFLIHLYGHLNYHLGQINYHRRLVGERG